MAGLMMFGKGLSVQKRFANFRMDFLDFCNLIGEESYSDQLTYDGHRGWGSQPQSHTIPTVPDLLQPEGRSPVQTFWGPRGTFGKPTVISK